MAATLEIWLRTAERVCEVPGTLALLLGTGAFPDGPSGFLLAEFGLGAARVSAGRRAGAARGVSPFAALMTALAATIGTGNIVGVATALTAGGPGALVWMEVSALLGMATKFTECTLAVKYRRRDRQGQPYGGPMYVMADTLGRPSASPPGPQRAGPPGRSSPPCAGAWPEACFPTRQGLAPPPSLPPLPGPTAPPVRATSA